MNSNLCDDFSKHKIEGLLNQKINILFFEELDSTNTYLKNSLADNLPIPTVVIANNQTCGRGSKGRSFFGAEQSGIYMSILLKPDFDFSQAINITALSAVAVCEAIENLCDKNPKIKWVNDVLIDNKKVCGILTEGAILPQSQKFGFAIVGIGVNVFTPKNDFSKEIKNIAGAVFDNPNKTARSQLCAEILTRFFKYYNDFENKTFLNPYKAYSAVIGKEIYAVKNNEFIPCTALDIDDNCRLLVKYKNNTTEYLNSGEISIKL